MLAETPNAGPLQRVHGEAGARCRAAWRQLADLTDSARRKLVASLSRRLFGPVPPHLLRSHPGWIEECLAAEPPRLAGLVRETLPPELVAGLPPPQTPPPAAPPMIRTALCHAVLAELPGLEARPAAEEDPPPLRDLAASSPERLLELVRRLGLLALAAMLARAPDLGPRLLARLPAQDVKDLQRLLGASRRPALTSLTLPELGSAPEELAPRLGAQLLGRGLPAASRPALALLLPPQLGRLLLSAPLDLPSDRLLDLLRWTQLQDELS